MDFYIKKNATLPKLYMEFVQSGYDNNWEVLYNRLENTEITFTMSDKDTCIPKVKCSIANLVEDVNCKRNCLPKYYLEFPFSKTHTSKVGHYIGEFNIRFLDNDDTLKTPIRETLNIYVID